MFKTGKYSNEIIEKEIIRTTEHQVVYLNHHGKEDREAKIGSYHVWHETKNLAENYLLNRIDRNIRYAEEQIERLKNDRIKLIESSETLK